MGRETEIRSDGAWLVISVENNPTIRVDVRALDSLSIDEGELVLEVDETRSALAVPNACGSIDALCSSLAPYTRESPIVDPSIYKDAVAYRAHVATGLEPPMVVVGSDAVLVQDPYVAIGRLGFRLNQVEEYAQAGANLPLTGGRLVQAAMVTLVVAASKRDVKAELRRLTTRLGAYRPPAI